MTPLVRRPRLALRAGAITCDALADDWLAASSRDQLRERALARAAHDLDTRSFSDDPSRALWRATGRHEGLLSGYEQARARAWIEQVDGESLGAHIRTLIEEAQSDFAGALERFWRWARALHVSGEASINDTVVSYWLAAIDPQRYAFIKPEGALQPAWRLLADPEAQRLPTSPERLAIATDFYREIAQLWSEHLDFEGDLFDVHVALSMLATGAPHAGASWARALDVEDVCALVHEGAASERGVEDVRDASEQLRECCFDASLPRDPYHALALEDYAHAYGAVGSGRTLSRIAEYTTRAYSRLHLNSANAFGVSQQADGAWRVAGVAGTSEEEAQAWFETRIKPRLRELCDMARVMMGSLERAPLSLLSREPYRSLDGKLLLLTLAAYDPEWTWRHVAPVNRASDLVTIASMCGIDAGEITSLARYVDVQAQLRARVEGASAHDRAPALGAIAAWASTHPLGRMITAQVRAELGIEADEASTEQEAEAPSAESDLVDASPPLDASTKEGAASVDSPERSARLHARALDAWEEFIASLTDARHERLARLLRARKNVVLYGPPGTGKTILSTQLASRWRRWQKDAEGARPCVEQITFHPSYGYEEFVEGFRPDPAHPGQFVLRSGLLTSLAERAIDEPRRQFLLLIDELNRGDVARIFGELITIIEPDKRSIDHARRRMLSGQPLWLPPNLFVLATMNTADKSISLLDVAIRRRFAFEHVPPDPSLLDHEPGLVREVHGVYLSALLGALNARLARVGVFPERWLGHSFLWMPASETDDPLEALSRRFQLDIIPLIEEYCFADRRQIRQVLGPLVDAQGQPNERVLCSRRLAQAIHEIVEEESGSTTQHEPDDDDGEPTS